MSHCWKSHVAALLCFNNSRRSGAVQMQLIPPVATAAVRSKVVRGCSRFLCAWGIFFALVLLCSISVRFCSNIY